MENIMEYLPVVSAVAALIIYVLNTIKRVKDGNISDILTAAQDIVEEAISVSAVKNNQTKKEAAITLGKNLNKSPEISKDPMKVEKAFHEAVKPAREMAHNFAVDYINKAANEIGDKTIKNGVCKIFSNRSIIDEAIKTNIAGKKEAIQNPIKSMLFRELKRK